MADEQSIFLRALEMPTGEQRQKFLAEACGDDAPLRSRIEALLARHADDAGFLEPPGPGQQATVAFDNAARTVNSPAGEVNVGGKGEGPSSPQNLRPGATVRYIGDYEVISEVARGGMGVVYKARQVRLKRIVALKMILSGEFASEADIRRFHTEAEAAAQLDHPHIVPVYEVGQHQGIHYFSMGFVDGSPMSARIAEAPYAARDAATIVRALAEAVHYAHGRGVIHRDLKPSNVMIDKSGQPRVTDFGLAKQTKGNSSLTGTGFILGTPSYMPPEQATGRTDLIGERADIYALGAILYAALTGRPPFQADSPLETLRQVMQQEPVAPRQLNPSIPRDLETICLRCLEKQMHRRYETALQLADELGRFLEGKPILARPVRSHERLWKWCRRNRIVAGLLATIAASLVIGTIVSTYFAVEAGRRANENLDLANKNLLLAAQEGRARAAAEDSRRAAQENEKVAKRQTRVAQLESANLNLNEAHIHCEKGDPQAGLLWMAAAHDRATQAGDADLADACRSMASLWLPQVPRLKEVYGTTRRTGAAFGAGDQTIIQVDWAWEFSADQRESENSVNMALERGMTILDTATGAVLENVPQVRSPDKIPVLSPDRTRILLLDQEHQPRIWSIPDRTWVGDPLTPAGPIHQARFSGDGWRLVTMSREGQVEFWNASDGQPVGTAIQHEQHASPNFGALALMPQGQIMVTSGRSGELRFWDPNNSAEVWERLTGRSGHVPDLAVQPQGGLLATYRNNVTPKIVTHWLNGQHTVGGEAVTDFRLHALKYSPDGRWLAEGATAINWSSAMASRPSRSVPRRSRKAASGRWTSTRRAARCCWRIISRVLKSGSYPANFRGSTTCPPFSTMRRRFSTPTRRRPSDASSPSARTAISACAARHRRKTARIYRVCPPIPCSRRLFPPESRWWGPARRVGSFALPLSRAK
jgi:serine/threonine protein kinase